VNARANHGVARHAHKECGGRLVDQVFIQIKLLLYVIVGWTWKAARHRATKKWQVHISFYGARFRGARGRSCVIAGLAWHASILATLLRAKVPRLALKSPQHHGLRTNAPTASLRRNSLAHFTGQENTLRVNGNPSSVGLLVLVNQQAHNSNAQAKCCD
jgi:hypothetical protein